jgi:hypothetical protein
MQFSFFKEDCGGCCSVVHADRYFFIEHANGHCATYEAEEAETCYMK